ncbi:MAG: zinc ribbon domain-containing protein, partial [Acidobacteriaceae bacterium]|nr:zinc ribbon domain-containing protein [Acidobacteriaceae bacterium]
MEPRCTCGAVLPADARFCHKCGKPQFEEDLARLAEQEQAAPPTPSPVVSRPSAVTAISFRNSRAVVTTIGAAAAAFVALVVLSLLVPGVAPFVLPLVLVAAGFFAASSYNRRSSQPLTGAGGARLGWMTGLWFFVELLIISALAAAVLTSPVGAEALKQLQSRPQFAQMKFPNSNEIAGVLLQGTIQTFFLSV